ncbi:MAG: SDR family oxidoreductase [Oscillospiraceae bacterium]|jgi:NAD(P)-dependent dehydrogenase (short-subunit alcohol dehydrogenase family)|nr:SDR family oxidoreductase [Oscillospiraceae bacterium]
MEQQAKTALVIGASRGIGHATAVKLARQGYDIAFTYHTCEEAAQATLEEIRGLGRRCFCYQAVMQEKDAPKTVVSRAIADLGRLDALITVAGVTRHYRMAELTAEDIDEVYACNYRAMLLCAGAAAKHMIEQKIPGNIIHIASTHAYCVYPTDQVYGGLKAAIVRSCESEALELSQYGIRVNCVAPGMTSTRGPDTPNNLQREWFQQIPLGRCGMAGEVADAIVFLISDEARFITGVTLKVDGGLSLPAMPEDASPEAGYGWCRRGF